jgi:SAM-dependent methyltransferase
MAAPTQAEHWGGTGGEHWVRHQGRYDTMLADFGLRVLEAARLQPGDAVLDVGCGCGATTLEIARRVGPRGSVVGADLSPPMIARARERAAAEGLAHAAFVVADAQTHAFEPGRADALTSRFGVMFFPDPEAAFLNLARAARAGARLAFACWQAVTANEWMMVPGMAAAAHVGLPEMGPPGAPGPFAFADPDRVRGILAAGGWTDAALDEVSLPMRFGADVGETVELFTGTELVRRLFANADAERTAAALDAVREALRPFAGPDGVRMRGSAWLVTARRA